MLDPQDEQFDRRLARHLVSLYHQSQQDEEEEELVRFLDTKSTNHFVISSTNVPFK